MSTQTGKICALDRLLLLLAALSLVAYLLCSQAVGTFFEEMVRLCRTYLL